VGADRELIRGKKEELMSIERWKAGRYVRGTSSTAKVCGAGFLINKGKKKSI